MLDTWPGQGARALGVTGSRTCGTGEDGGCDFMSRKSWSMSNCRMLLFHLTTRVKKKINQKLTFPVENLGPDKAEKSAVFVT